MMDNVWYISEVPPATSLVLIVCAITLLAFKVWPFRTRAFPTIAGPCSSWSIVGVIPQIFGKGVVACDLEWRKKYGKVFGDWMGAKYSLMTSDADMIREAFCTQSWNFPHSARTLVCYDELQQSALPFIYDYPRWKAVRSIVTPTFSSGKLKQIAPSMQHAVHCVIDDVCLKADEGNSVEMKAVYGAYTMQVISSLVFGLDIDPVKQRDHPFIQSATDSIRSFIGNPFTLLASMYPCLSPLVKEFGPFIKRSQSVQFLDDIITRTLHERRADKTMQHRKDLLQLLIDAKVDDPDLEGIDPRESVESDRSQKVLTDLEIRAQSIVFLLAGFDTTATTLSFMSYLLATHPEIQTRLCQEIDDVLNGETPDYDNIGQLQYLDMCLHESMRLFPPVVRMSRTALEDISIKGYFIPAGTGINVPIYVLHHDPDYWPEPEKFNPERFSPENKKKNHPYAWVPFSAGLRNCVGKRFALLAAKIAIATFLQNVCFEVAPETQIPIQLGKGFMLSAQKGIHLRVKRR